MLFLVIFILILFLYSLFSYILTEPNLILSSHPLYWNFQLAMWEKFYHQSQFITASYIFLILMLFLCFAWILSELKKDRSPLKLNLKSKYLWLYGLILTPLSLSYNALSHDIFNYAFNARMVLKWGYNPHVKTALDFIQIDDWVRFMHNIHTTAPYGYGWTVISLIPAFLGMEKFLPSLFFFRLFMILSIFLLYVALQHLSNTINKRNLNLYELALVFLNPLLLLEVVSNYHNDLWMMAPAVLSVSMLLRMFQPKMSEKSFKYKMFYFLILILLLLFSISIKIVTILLVPLFVFGLLLIFFLPNYANLIQKRFNIAIPGQWIAKILIWTTLWIEKYIPTILAIVLFIPLFTLRSQQFLSWYMLWIIVWLPFIQSKTIKNTILIFCLSSLLRYVPWLYNGFEYSQEIIFQQKLITWLIPTVYLFTNMKNFRSTMKLSHANN
jgi:hypothetical protein